MHYSRKGKISCAVNRSYATGNDRNSSAANQRSLRSRHSNTSCQNCLLIWIFALGQSRKRRKLFTRRGVLMDAREERKRMIMRQMSLGSRWQVKLTTEDETYIEKLECQLAGAKNKKKTASVSAAPFELIVARAPPLRAAAWRERWERRNRPPGVAS